MANRNRRRGTMPRANLQTVQTRDGRRVEKLDADEPIWPGRKPGRPSKLTADVEKRFMDCIRAGNYQTVCSRLVGLSPQTVDNWLARGRGHDDRPASPEYVRFVRLLDEAKASTEALVVGNMIADTKTDQRAREFWLRADPERAKRWPKDGADYVDVPAAPGSVPMIGPGNVTFDQRRQTAYVMIGREEAEGIVAGMLVQGRQERAARLAAQVVEEDERPADGTRIARLDGLRSDEGVTNEDD